MKRQGLKILAAALVFVMTAIPSWAGKLVMKGSTTVLPIAQKAAEAYMNAHPDIDISLSGGGSSNGIKAILDGTAHIGNASRFIKQKEVKIAVVKDIYPVPHRIALDCIVPVVNSANPVNNLSKSQLKDIYTGKIRNWKEVGGNDERIVVITRDSSSGTFDAWKSLVMNKERVVPSALTQPSNGGLVTQISNTPGSLGYIALGYVNSEIKSVAVDGVMGNIETTLNGKYGVSRPLYMFTSGWPKGDTLNFINFLLSTDGQKLVREAGSISLY